MLTHRLTPALAIVLLLGVAACERDERGPPPMQETSPAATPAPPAPTPAPGTEPEAYGTEVDPIVADTAPPPRPIAPEERVPPAPPPGY